MAQQTELSQLINQQVTRKLEALPQIDATNSGSAFDTRAVLTNVAVADPTDPAANEKLAFLARKVDVVGKLFNYYDEKGRKSTDAPLDTNWLELLTVLMARRLIGSNDLPNGLLLKGYNTLFKCIDLTSQQSLGRDIAAHELLEVHWLDAVDRIRKDGAMVDDDDIAPAVVDRRLAKTQTVLPLHVLFYEGPIARAYLETLHSIGIRPARITTLIAARDIATKKPVGRFLPGSLSKRYAASVQRNRIHHWPNALLRAHPHTCALITQRVADSFDIDEETMIEARVMHPMTRYCDNVDEVMIEGLEDPALHAYLAELPPTTLLFTGGGIMPASLLSLPQLVFLHVHPGHLPKIRGADCLLWSQLVSGRPSASCFIMKPGIDMGDIIEANWLPKITMPPEIYNLGSKGVYRALYAFVDPWVRSCVLRATLLKLGDITKAAGKPQTEASGDTYHFMHDKVRDAAFKSFAGD